ncbi:MAG TPA: hypothetical protein VIT43_00595 [Candidatus Dormibacteraeota bacterium]
MKWLSFINGLAGILLILIGASGVLSNHMAATAVAILGLVVLVLSALRWITGFGRFSSNATLHTA